ncbi:DUF3943 domain-containing protein [Bacteriovorax sp. Seq25_V]|uniref:DUF3943 domain-containing protein n=1 Tax=Bacteriovorax sp. Seq25_V TaxID=1201288 RepID=UPI00038A52B4|nr:DUF3943 domain-containing protein [Bacteriovorax sp. Seq25_V]EQC44190.1 PF13084 domain protein [Bacteriovorax sp. Seq25_V]
MRKNIISILAILTISTSAFAEREKITFKPQSYQVSEEEQKRLDYEWMFNPLSKHMTREEWNNVVQEMDAERELKEKQRVFGQAKVITIDTRDKRSCEEIQQSLRSNSSLDSSTIDNLCAIDKSNPYVSVMVKDEYQTDGISFSELSETQQNVVRQTRNFTALGAGMVGLLWMMPESVTKWDKDEIGALGSKYMDNIKAGPVVDKDDWAVNYIGHPYSGAAYYVVGRHAGLSKMQSFGYSVFMSTVFWEYGFEAAAEIPSIQDLIVTPVIGSLMGEAFMQLSEKIVKNNGEVLGSKLLGTVALGIMDPAGAILDGINNVFENKYIKDARTYFYTRPAHIEGFAPEGK